MRLLGPDLRPIDAELSLQPLGPSSYELILESSGGSSRGRAPRNAEYTIALETALQRLGELDARLTDAMVVSRVTAHLPDDSKRITPVPWTMPVRLSDVTDFGALRRALTRQQSGVGSRRAGGGGNERKRLALRLELGRPTTPESVRQILRTAPEGMGGRRSDLASGLSVENIRAAIGEWDRVGREAFLSAYAAHGAERYVLVEDGREYDAMALLLGAATKAGTRRTDARYRGDGRTVAEPLRRMGFLVDDTSDPVQAPLGPDPQAYLDRLDLFTGDTDAAPALRAARREQKLLRGALGIGTGRAGATARCGLCGREFPEALLVAAHVKPRYQCTEEERLDMPAIAMPACLLGCDALYEFGYLTVGQDGVILTAPTPNLPEALATALVDVFEARAPAWSPASEPYFAWHRENVFRR